MAPRKSNADPGFRDLVKGLGARINALRNQRGESMDVVAKSCGLSRGTMHNLENPGDEGGAVSLVSLWAISRHFGVSLSSLLSGLEPEHANEEAGRAGPAEGAGTRRFEALGLVELDIVSLQRVSQPVQLQLRAELAEAACDFAKDREELESLSRHATKLRQKRYLLLRREYKEDGGN